MNLQDAKQFVLNLLFPARCPWCNAVMGFSKECSCGPALASLQLPNAPLNLQKEGQSSRHIVAAWACYRYNLPVSGAIVRLKFEEDRLPVQQLGTVMAAKFKACRLQELFDVMVPVPVSARTAKRRGYNQSFLLAEQLQRQTGMPMAVALQKPVETPPQMSLGRKERKSNVLGAYSVCLPQAVQGRRVLLIDDIITTGSTVNECAKTLLQAGAASCGALCLASTGKDHVFQK